MAGDTKQDEIDALRQAINDDAVRHEHAVKMLQDLRDKLKEKTDPLEADGSIAGGHFQPEVDLLNEAITYLTPMNGAVRAPDGSSADLSQKAVHPDPSGGVTSDPKIGVVTEENNTISHQASESIGVSQK